MLYLLGNFPKNTTAAPAGVTTGTTIKTLLQTKLLVPARVVDWWISFDGYAAATPIKVELVEVDVAATITQFVAADITGLDAEAVLLGDPTSALIDVSATSKSGYTSSNEGTVTAVRNLAPPAFVAPTTEQLIQLPLGRTPYCQPSKYQRIRVTAPAAVNAICGLTLEF